MLIPFKLKGAVDPYEGSPHPWVAEILNAGWTELKSLLGNVPNIDRNNRSVEVESKESLQWCWDNSVLIKPTDKNLSTALVSAEWYNEKVDAFILANDGYRFVTDEEARAILINKVKSIRRLCLNKTTHSFTAGDLPKFLSSRLPQGRIVGDILPEYADNPEDLEYEDDDWEALILDLPIFNGLPKIHKSPWGIRPVIPCHSVIQGPVSEFLSKLLKTLLADHPQILTSTKELVHAFEMATNDKLSRLSGLQWRNNVYICTADIEGFYTNVPIDDCQTKLKDLVLDHFDRDDPKSREKANYIIELFSIQQDDLLFKAKVAGDWEIIRQVNGLAMGMPAAPDIANLFAAWYEKRLPLTFHKQILLFKRYIDDIICIVYADSLSHCEQTLGIYNIPGLKLNWEISGTNAVFLDLDIWRSPFSRDQRLKYRPYRKPLNNFERLPWCTGHSLQLLRGAFKSEVHRMAVGSWSTHIYAEELVWLKDLYISRGYPPATVMQWIQSTKDNAYKKRLEWTFEEELGMSERIWPLKSTMNPVWQKLNLGMVSEAMRRRASIFITEERARYERQLLESLGEVTHMPDLLPFASDFSKWFGRLVASQKRPINFGNKENKHNRSLLGIQGKHAKIALTGRSIDQREEDELRQPRTGTLDNWLATGRL